MHRAQQLSAWQRFVGGAAQAAGTAVRWIGQSASEVVGIPSAALVAYGLGQVYGPLLWISAGVIGLAVARNLRLPR